MLTQTSISISNEKTKFFCENHNRRKDSNFVQNNHRRLNRCRFRILFVQTLCQAWTLNLSWSVFFNSIFHWYRCLWLCFRSLQSDQSNLWSLKSRVNVAFQIKTFTWLWWCYFIYRHARHLFQYSNKRTQAIHHFHVHCRFRRSRNHFEQIMNESMWFVVEHEEWQFNLLSKNFVN